MPVENAFEDRAKGVLLGLACGDALGRPVEFASPEQIKRDHGRVTEMLGNGTHRQPAGTITDDTEMALCIARSVVEQDQFDPADVAERFVAWYESGPFDIGGMTRRALSRIQDGESWETAGEREWEASPEGSNAGNGSVMRCAPLAIAYADYPAALVRTSIDSSRITHADPRCTFGCAVLNLTIAAALQDQDAPLSTALHLLAEDLATSMQRTAGVIPDGASPVLEGGIPEELRTTLEAIPDGINPDQLSNSGYVVDTLQTALYDAVTAESAEEAIITAVNRGGDTDTIGAIAGAIAGARFGGSSLPNRWLDEIDECDEFEQVAIELAAHPHGTGSNDKSSEGNGDGV
ncbi:ADP-ribosylglycohydrolase family protein [Halobellus ordinarius]|uniref:ADP-ribosylglycohydrolase family protein n=1 Tax=Halobellus ordinarius TaxID=3075120 RepID=UPI00288059D0|nr:ADP-ribosylglycohydrolase family protein [Halobellus sp. ZY16]